MIEILKRPEPKKREAELYQANCECGCVFRFDSDDWEWSVSGGIMDRHIKCPMCDRIMIAAIHGDRIKQIERET